MYNRTPRILMVIALIMALITTTGVSSLAKTSENTKKYDSNDKVSLSDYHKDLIRCYGLTESEIDSITLGKLRKVIKYGEFKDISHKRNISHQWGLPHM